MIYISNEAVATVQAQCPISSSPPGVPWPLSTRQDYLRTVEYRY